VVLRHFSGEQRLRREDVDVGHYYILTALTPRSREQTPIINAALSFACLLFTLLDEGLFTVNFSTPLTVPCTTCDDVPPHEEVVRSFPLNILS